MNYTLEPKDNNLIIKISGRVDTNSIKAFENEFFANDIVNSYDTYIFDFENVNYISSTGLRFFLKTSKKDKKLSIINVSLEVYEIFEITDFIEMFPIQKAYRKISVDGCEIIGRGANGIVYKIDSETILKLYIKPDVLDKIKSEREHAKYALIMGIPTAISFDIVKVGDLYGMIFELIDAKSIASILKDDPTKLNEYLPEYVKVLKTIHSIEYAENEKLHLPKSKELFTEWIANIHDSLPKDIITKLINFTDSLPEANTLIHGDCQPNNLMVTNDEIIFIDMDTLAVGDPIFELAFLYSALIGFGICDPDDNIMGLDRKLMYDLWEGIVNLYYPNDTNVINIKTTCILISSVQLFKHAYKNLNRRGEDFYNRAYNNLIDSLNKI